MKTSTLNAKIKDYNAKHTTEKKTVKNIVFDQLHSMGYTVTNWDEVKTLAAEVSAPPYNYVTEREYTGVNTLLLPYGAYMTWKQIQNMGAKVRKGSKSYIVVYCSGGAEMVENENGEIEVKKTTPVLKYYRVFNTNDVDGLPSAEPETYTDAELENRYNIMFA